MDVEMIESQLGLSNDLFQTTEGHTFDGVHKSKSEEVKSMNMVLNISRGKSEHHSGLKKLPIKVDFFQKPIYLKNIFL